MATLPQLGGPPQQWRQQDLVQLISDRGAAHVPARYIRSPHDSFSAQPALNLPAQLPVIDLDGLLADNDIPRSRQEPSRRERIAAQIADACQTRGSFQVVNHGIPPALMEAAMKAVRGFFELPAEERLKYSFDSLAKHPAGYGRNYDFEGLPLDWVDILKHNIASPSLTDKSLWPAEPVEYREIIEAYGKGIIKLMDTLLAIISQNLGLKPSYLEDAVGEATVLLRSNYYPPCPQPDLVAGLKPHSDASVLTVLQQEAGVKGLQVLDGDQWATVEPLEGALVVNVGDMLQLISNGRYESLTHRAETNLGKSRLSMATFMFAQPEKLLAPPGELLGGREGRLYRSITSGEYMGCLRRMGIGNRHIIHSLLIQQKEQEEDEACIK